MQYILQYKGKGRPKRQKIMTVLTDHDAQIIDGSDLPEMALLELTPTAYNELHALTAEEWNLSLHKTSYASVPSTRKKLRG
jgi:hypothetical protein